MANQLKMAMIQALLALHARGWSKRRIARELGIDRGTVARYLQLAGRANPAISLTGSNPAESTISLTGSDGSADAKPTIFPVSDPAEQSKPATLLAGSAAHPDGPEPVSTSKPAISLTGSAAADAAGMPPGADPLLVAVAALAQSRSAGRLSACTPWAEVIDAKLSQGLSAQRIYQDLVTEHGFAGSYSSVQRYVRRRARGRPLPMRRLECAPGQEVQVDFGQGAPVIDAQGKRRRPHVFRIVLSHSRKAYSEVVFRQTTEDFLRCLENAFWQFGGVPETVILDNLKAAVTQADWFDPELNPKVQAFAAHYGTVFLPTKPRTPRHKGKVERGVDYVQENALKGHTFQSLEEQNRHLCDWESTVADTRIHGTTRRQVGKVFAEIERPALKPLPRERFPFFHEGQRSVNRDGHIEVDKAYYSAPPEYLGRRVWVRWDSRIVRIFNQRMEPLITHVKREPGRFSTHPGHIVAEKISGVERGTTWLLSKASRVGPHTAAWAEALLSTRGIEGVRVLMGLISLAGQHPADTLEEVCALAHAHGAYRLRTLRQLLKRQGPQQRQQVFLEVHPLIRRLDEYAEVVRRSLHGANGSGEAPVSTTGEGRTGSSSLLPKRPQRGIDYRQLRTLVSIREVLELLSFRASAGTGEQVRGRCPLHGSTSPKSRVFSAHLAKNLFRCFKCQAAGNHLDLWAAATRQPLYQAALDLCNRLQRPVPWLCAEPTACAAGS
jgi:transposase